MDFEKQLIKKRMIQLIEDSSKEAVRELVEFLKNGFDVNEFVLENSRRTIVDLAAFSGNLEVLKESKKFGAEFETCDETGASALNQACMFYGAHKKGTDHLGCIKFLARHVSKINTLDTSFNRTPYDELSNSLFCAVDPKIANKVLEAVAFLTQKGAVPAGFLECKECSTSERN